MVFLGDILSALQEQGFGLLLRGDQIGPQTGEKRFGVGDGVEQQQLLFCEILHLKVPPFRWLHKILMSLVLSYTK